MDVLEKIALLVFASSEDSGLAYHALEVYHAIQVSQAFLPYLEWGASMDWVYAETYGKVLVVCAENNNH